MSNYRRCIGMNNKIYDSSIIILLYTRIKVYVTIKQFNIYYILESETPRARSCSGSVEDLSKNSLMSNTQLETRRDYQALREKLGAEFHQKLIEWERLKRSTGGNTRSTRDVFTPSNGIIFTYFNNK